MSSILTIIGVVALILALLISGILGSGDRIRANYTNEEKEDRRGRLKVSGILFLIGILSFVINYFFFA